MLFGIVKVSKQDRLEEIGQPNKGNVSSVRSSTALRPRIVPSTLFGYFCSWGIGPAGQVLQRGDELVGFPVKPNAFVG